MAEYLIVLETPKVVALLRDTLRANQLTVTEGPDGAFLLVSAPMAVLEREAEWRAVMKTRVADGKVEVFVAARRSSYVGGDAHGGGSSCSSSLWASSELAFLLWSLIERAPLSDDLLLEPLLAEASFLHRHEALEFSKDSLIKSLRVLGLVSDASPLHSRSEANKVKFWGLALAPADALASYLGAKVAFYFEWMNFFTSWLCAPAVVGACVYARRSYFADEEVSIDDDPYAPAHALFTVLWGALFVACWKRRESETAMRWGSLFARESDEYSGLSASEVRPGFRGELRTSPVTGRSERYYPQWKRLVSYAVSGAVTCVMLSVALAWHVVSLNLQGLISGDTSFERLIYIAPCAQLAATGAWFDPHQTRYLGLLVYVPTVVHVLVVQQLNGVYRVVADKLTWAENHETEAAFENANVLKRFCFEAFDAYAALFYLAFVSFDIVKLRTELVAIYTIDSLRRVLMETLVPLALSSVSKRATQLQAKKVAGERKKKDDDAAAATADGARDESLALAITQLQDPEYEQFDDYLEMVISFGYVTLFASAFPLAPLLSVLCNVVETKSDIFKLLRVYRRPPAQRVATIGTWSTILTGMMWLAIATNTALFAFSSEQMAVWAPSLFKRVPLVNAGFSLSFAKGAAKHGAELTDAVAAAGSGRFVALIAVAIEHSLALAALLILSFVAPRPEWVRQEVARLSFEKANSAKDTFHGQQKR